MFTCCCTQQSAETTTKIAAKTAAYTTAQGGVTLQALAQAAGATGVAIDAYITAALANTGIFADAACTGTADAASGGSTDCPTIFAAAASTLAASCPAGCTYAEAGPVAYDDGREEAYKKGVFNQLMAHLTITTAQAAVDLETANAGTGTAKWNEAWAIYGYLGNAAAGSTLYATANKRCKNYGTCDSTKTGAQTAGDASECSNGRLGLSRL